MATSPRRFPLLKRMDLEQMSDKSMDKFRTRINEFAFGKGNENVTNEQLQILRNMDDIMRRAAKNQSEASRQETNRTVRDIRKVKEAKAKTVAARRRDGGDDDSGEDDERGWRPKRTKEQIDRYNAEMRAAGLREWPKQDNESPEYTKNRLKEEAEIAAGTSAVGKPLKDAPIKEKRERDNMDEEDDDEDEVIAEREARDKARQKAKSEANKTQSTDAQSKTAKVPKGKNPGLDKIVDKAKADGKQGWITINGNRIFLG